MQGILLSSIYCLDTNWHKDSLTQNEWRYYGLQWMNDKDVYNIVPFHWQASTTCIHQSVALSWTFVQKSCPHARLLASLPTCVLMMRPYMHRWWPSHRHSASTKTQLVRAPICIHKIQPNWVSIYAYKMWLVLCLPPCKLASKLCVQLHANLHPNLVHNFFFFFFANKKYFIR